MKIHNEVRKKQNTIKHLKVLGALALGLTAGSAMAGTNSWDFTTDPTLGANPLDINLYGPNSTHSWKVAGGNPGGFLGLTWPIGSSSAIAIFPDIDAGKLVTSFTLETDLRVGNPQQADRAADGFSISFARSTDPVFTVRDPASFAVSGAVETGTQTGIAISFDTWSGNALPDGPDIEGIIVRVDNVTVLRTNLPTRNGACADITSLQTGPRNTDYWVYWKANGFDQNLEQTAAVSLDSWTNLCWQPLKVELDTQSRLTVVWKGATILDKYQTTFFPSAGALVLAGRTGGADQHTHFDNLRLTTTAVSDATPPTAPTALAAIPPVGANHVILTWTASTDDSGRVAYEVDRNGVVIAGTVTTNRFEDFPPKANTAYTYRVRAKDPALNVSAYASIVVTTAADVPQVLGTVKVDIYTGITGTDNTVAALLGDLNYPNNPATVRYALGGMIGSPNGLGGWNESFGNNLGVRVTGVLTPTETASYDFFIRSDDGSAFYLNQTGAAIPDPLTTAPTIEELLCCSTFLEPNDLVKPTVTTPTPIALTAGQSYGFVILMKEGGGGDGVGVGMRKVGDPTPAANVPMISPLLIKGTGDPIGAVIDITSAPASISIGANEPVSFSVTDSHSTFYGNEAWYQWLRNGALIPGATATNYAIPVVLPGDNNVGFSVMIGVRGLVKTSTVATLTVTADITKPTITSVNGSDTFNNITIAFSEPVTAPTATTAGNYTLSGGLVASAPVLLDPFHVRVTTTAQAVGTNYTLTVNNVQDNAGNPIAAGSQFTFGSYGLVAGRVKFERYNNLPGNLITDLDAAILDPKYPNSPDVSTYLENGLTYGEPGFGDTHGDNYLARLTGVLIPKVSGSYNFFVRSDDASAFYINKTGPGIPDATTATRDAQEHGCCNPFEEIGIGDNGDGTFPTSTNNITLVAGQQYGVLFLVKEGAGGDWGQVAMRLAGATNAAATLPRISDQIYANGPPAPAGVISVDFRGRQDGGSCPPMAPGDVAGVLQVANWNSVDDSKTLPTSENGTTAPLKNAAGTVTPVTLTFAANDSWNNDVDNATITTGNARMMKGVIKRQGAGTSATFTFNNVPNGQYDAYVYITSNNDNVALDVTDYNSGATYYVTAVHRFNNNDVFVQATNQVPPVGTNTVPRDVGSYVKLSNISTSGGRIALGAKYISGGDGLGIAGIQIVTPQGSSVVAPQKPTLSFSKALNGDLIITFQGTLEGTDSLSGTPVWTTVSTVSPSTNSTTGAAKFFRAKQ